MSTLVHVTRRSLLSGLAISLTVPIAFAQDAAKPAGTLVLWFDSVRYIHRWSSDGQHEFTPEGEDDLKRWTNMVSINRHRGVSNGKQLAEVANRIAGNYRQHRRILKTSSRPAAPDKPAEHLAVALFARPAFIEAAFTRIFLVHNAGFVMTYSRRIHDHAAGPKMAEWLLSHGPRLEAALLGWRSHETLSSLSPA